jgi:glycosyltransferase involved in cell wall biosynthesis
MTHHAMERLPVVALAYHFAPAPESASIRNTKILRHLPRFNVDLDLITVRTRYLSSGQNQDLLNQVPADVNVVRTRCVFPHSWLIKLKSLAVAPVGAGGSNAGPISPKAATPRSSTWQTFKDVVSYALMIPDKYVGWYPFALWTAYQQMRKSKSEVIYAVGQPWTSFFVGYTLKLLSGKPLVIDFMDPWASRSQAWDHDKPKVLNRIAARLENFIVPRADFVVANTEELAEDFRSRFRLPPEKLGVITCGFDPADFQSLPDKHGGDVLVITHTGSCYGLRSPVNLLRAVKTLIDGGRLPRGAIRLNFIGYVPVNQPELAALLADPVISEAVHIESWVPHATALEYLSRSDVLLLLQPGLQLVVPAKLYEYAAIGRPILALAELDGAVARVVSEDRLGVTVDNDDVQGIAREIERLFGEFRQRRLMAGYTTSDVARYSVENLAAALSDILHQVRRSDTHQRNRKSG